MQVTLINSANESMPYEDGGGHDPIIWDVTENQITKNFVDEGVAKSNTLPYSVGFDSIIQEQIRLRIMHIADTILILKTIDSVEDFTGQCSENCIKVLRFRKCN